LEEGLLGKMKYNLQLLPQSLISDLLGTADLRWICNRVTEQLSNGATD